MIFNYKKGQVIENFQFKISGITIPTLKEKLFKSLYKTFNNSMKDNMAMQQIINEPEVWLEKLTDHCYQLDSIHGYSL